MQNYRLFLIFIFIGISYQISFARHIVGGEIYYECLGKNANGTKMKYRFTMYVYRDCFSVASAELDGVAQVGIYIKDTANTYRYDTLADVPLNSRRILDPTNNDPCITPPRVCVEEGVYIFEKELKIIDFNYVIVYQRCCRNITIGNILKPDEQGAAYYVEITPQAQRLCNNSPRFKSFPPIVICSGQPLAFDHGATDKEGDLITYEFCAPFTAGGQKGSTAGNGNPSDCDGVMPDREKCLPPFKTVTFLGPKYTATVPLGGNPVVKINPVDGYITGIPEDIGQFVVGVCIKEYRSGVLLSIVRRDFQFNVAKCDVKLSAKVQSDSISRDQEFVINSCGNNTIDFINQSTIQQFIKTKDWFFKVGNDTVRSNNDNFKVTFPSIGTYRGQLILNKGMTCSDTAFINVHVYPGLNADFKYKYDTCIAGPVSFTNLSTTGSGTMRSYDWTFSPGLQSMDKNPQYVFRTPGFKDVRLQITDINGCVDDTVRRIEYFPVPALLVIDPKIFVGCEPLPIFFENLSIPIDSTYDIRWDFGDGGTSNKISPTHIYQNKGLYSVSLKVTSPIGCHTEIAYSDWITVKESPKAAFDYTPQKLSSFNKSIDITDHSLRSQSVVYQLSTKERLLLRNPHYTFRDTGIYTITQYAYHENGCIDSLTYRIDVEPKVTFFMPNVFTPNGDGKNDEFFGKGAVDFMLNFQMTIWDRWGGKLFETNDVNQSWNGRFGNTGDFVSNGVYLYIVSYKTPRGQDIRLKGYATVLR